MTNQSHLVADGPDDLTASWLSEVLSVGGRRVQTDHVRVEAVGTGQMGESYRLSFVADGEERTLIAKLPNPDPSARSMAAPGYRSEMIFYEHLAARVAARIPACHFTAASDDWSRFTLLLEDLSPASQGDQIAGASADQVRMAAVNLAGLHGPRWNDPALWDVPHVSRTGPADVEFLVAIFDDAIATFVDRYGEALGDDNQSVLARVAGALPAFLLNHDDRFSVVHGDYRLDNLLFAPDGSGVAAVDFQTMTVGLPARDLAYLVATSLEPAARRDAERAIVTAYYEELVRLGVTEYTETDCWDDYVVGMLQGPLIIVLGATFGARTDRGDEMFTVMANRVLAAMRELGSIEAA